MLSLARVLCLAVALVFAASVRAQAPVVPNSDQQAMLVSPDPKLAANKRLVYDFWREVFEGLHMELAPKYLTDAYIQHNPNVPSGRAAFVDAFSKRGQPKTIEARVQAPLVSVVAERDLVILVFAREYADPKDAAQKYTTTWFDMFRIENGKIAEHWDPALKR